MNKARFRLTFPIIVCLFWAIFFNLQIFSSKATAETIKVPLDCPQFAPTDPNLCNEGTWVDGGINSNGCPNMPFCVKNNSTTCPENCTCQDTIIACPVKEDNNTIIETVIVISDTATCPVNCVCKGQEQTCKTVVEEPTIPEESPTCPENCTCENNIPTVCTSNFGVNRTTEELIPDEPKICPIGCICQNDVMACPSSETPISTTLEQEESRVKVTIIKDSEGKVKMTIPESNVEIVGNVSVVNNQLVGGQGNNLRGILLPTEIEQTFMDGGITEIILIDPDSKNPNFRYQIKETQKGKFLNIFPINYQTIWFINAETGKTISIKNPFWSILVK